MGAKFYQNDLTPNPNVFAAKIANQFLFGAQMGWFSLGGRSNQNPPMGLFELLMDVSYDKEIKYLRELSTAKRTASDWLVHGRAMRNIKFSVNGTLNWQTEPSLMSPHFRVSERFNRVGKTRFYKTESMSFDAVMSSAWLSPDSKEKSLLILITTVERCTLQLQ